MLHGRTVLADGAVVSGQRVVRGGEALRSVAHAEWRVSASLKIGEARGPIAGGVEHVAQETERGIEVLVHPEVIEVWR